MNDDALQDLYKMQRYAAGLQGLLENAERQGPQQVEATDPSGAVRVVLGADGLPETFTVDYDWKRHLRPEAFGRAVVQACQAAANRRLEAWATAISSSGFDEQAEQLRERVETEKGTEPPASVLRPSTDVRPRDLGELTRALLDATNDIGALATAPPAQGVGTTAFGKLTVTLSANGLESCTADQFWVSDKSGEELGEALATALAAARDELAKAARNSPVGRLEGLLDEALALLRNNASG